jgi:hypothetical protein
MINIDLDEKIARISDVLEQIENLNEMINFHRNNNGDNSTINQYQYMKRNFTMELSNLLKEFQLTPQFAELA